MSTKENKQGIERMNGWMMDWEEWKGSAFVFVVNDVREEDRIRYDNLLEKKSFGWTASQQWKPKQGCNNIVQIVRCFLGLGGGLGG